MTIRNSADVAFFLVGGYDVLGTLTKIDDQLEAILERTDSLGDLWEEQSFVGVRRSEITQEGFFNDDAGSVHDALSTGPGVSRVLAYGYAGTATGQPFIGWAGARQVNYDRLVNRAELHKARARYLSDGVVERGRILRSYGFAGGGVTATGASTGTPVDNIVSSTGGAGYLEYGNTTAANGEANVRILHSSNNITYTTLFTFAKTSSATGAKGAERLTTTGVIERYAAMDLTTASATGQLGGFSYFVGLVRV